MKYLVCRMDGVRPHNQIGSSLFPIVVSVDLEDVYPVEAIVRKAFRMISQDYVGMHDYLVVPLVDAQVVSFKPRQHYDVTVSSYDA